MSLYSYFRQRRAGILLHPTSLPGPGTTGDLGEHAYHFVDFLLACGHTVWQTLPLGPTHDDRSPYQCLSAYAGNPDLISLEALLTSGWLEAKDLESNAAHRPRANHGVLMQRAYYNFKQRAAEHELRTFHAFVDQENHWLEDYALFRFLRARHNQRSWTEWPAPERDRQPLVLTQLREQHAEELAALCFEQFLFFQQWQAMRAYARERGVLLFGDLPIFVAHDSSDVWSQRQYFELDEAGQSTVVAGVPPDYFSETGQRWGNPHYRWHYMEHEGFRWWIQRLQMQLKLFDVVRIDHFRGFEAYWQIPAHERTAVHGRWVKAPGEALFDTLSQQFNPLPIVAEDLGLITEEVTALREKYRLPGMRVLQFAFDGNTDNPHLPHNFDMNTVVYTGTHDNDTTLGWYGSLPDYNKANLHDYLAATNEPMPWPLIRLAHASVARLSMLPMQDILGLGSEHRMNIPGVKDGNWRWRFEWSQVGADVAPRLRRLAACYGRVLV